MRSEIVWLFAITYGEVGVMCTKNISLGGRGHYSLYKDNNQVSLDRILYKIMLNLAM